MPADHSHLESLLEGLVRSGNAIRVPFTPSQGGWWCQLDKPLDAAVCAKAVTENQSISFDPGDDALFCRHCWAAVYGGNHHFPTPAQT